MGSVKMDRQSLNELGEGLDQPILEKGNLCLFSLHTGKWAIKKMHHGVIEMFDEEPSEEYLQSLRDDGWTDIQYGN